MRAHSKRVTEVLGPQPPKYGIVLGLDPFTVELAEHRIQLTDDDLVLTQSARRYSLDHGIKVGDVVVVTQMGNGDWVLSEIVSDKTTFAGPDMTTVPPDGREFDTYVFHAGTSDASLTGGTTTIIALVPFRDSGGVIVGYIPLIA